MLFQIYFLSLYFKGVKGELGEKGVKGLRGPARYVFLLKPSYQVEGTQKSPNLSLLLSQKIQNSFKSIQKYFNWIVSRLIWDENNE